MSAVGPIKEMVDVECVFLTIIPPTAVLSTIHRISIFVGCCDEFIPLTLLFVTGDDEDAADDC